LAKNPRRHNRAKNEDPAHWPEETADLLYHLIVLLVERGLSLEQVTDDWLQEESKAQMTIDSSELQQLLGVSLPWREKLGRSLTITQGTFVPEQS